MMGREKMRQTLSAPPREGAEKMQKTQNIQDTLLNRIRRDRQSVVFFLMNGFQLRGVVRSFDNFVVILDSDGKQQMIYKHAISTIVPSEPVDISQTLID
jgi:host factor-I protein